MSLQLERSRFGSVHLLFTWAFGLFSWGFVYEIVGINLPSLESFLSANPDLLRKIQLLQIAPTSRGEVEAYQEIRSRVEALCGRINAAFSDVDWEPIHYVNRNIPRDELAGYYRAAKVGLVTPLRDG